MNFDRGVRSPGFRLVLAIIVALVLAIPLFSIYLLAWDRESQSREAAQSITSGWGAPQALTGPVLVIPYRASTTETVLEGGRSVTRNRDVMRELTLAPARADLSTDVRPEVRKRSIYRAVVYQARGVGHASFAFPPDLARTGLTLAQLDLSRAELRFGISDPRGLGANPRVSAGGQMLRLQPGGGSSGGRGFFAWLDASGLAAKPMTVDFAFDFRGNAALSLVPQAGDTRWTVRSSWPHPSFGGDFLPVGRRVGYSGFSADYRIGNLALGRALSSTADAGASTIIERVPPPSRAGPGDAAAADTASVQTAQISLIQPVDLYSRVNRAIKYGFLFIGFTFLALLMFDVIGGLPVSAVEYLLMGAALVMFFILLLALAEVIGFPPAYVLASAAVAGLNTAYSAAVLGSWGRAAVIGSLLVGLFALLYVLLSLEAFSLLIGSLMSFAALAGVMYATRRIDWGAPRETSAAA